MGSDSFVSGYVVGRGGKHGDNAAKTNSQAIAVFDYDLQYPFTNIFHCNPNSQHSNTPTICFVGCYNLLEEDWAEWMWKFSQLLSTLEAREAYVNLDCIRGNFRWCLQPRAVDLSLQEPRSLPESLIGEPWGITEAPENDLLLHPRQGDNEKLIWNVQIGKHERIVWTRQIERWR